MEDNTDLAKIEFTADDGQTVDLFILEQTRVNGVDYILVTDSEDEEAEAFIMKDVSQDSDSQSVYNIVEDDVEFDAVAKVFEELLEEEIDFEIE